MQPKTALSMTQRLPVSEEDFLYEARLSHTSIVDFGYSIENTSRPDVNLPPEGARYDIAVEGVIEGPRLKGTFKAVDYGNLRADGRFQLLLHGTITTDDGANISLYADGIFRPENGDVFENVQLKTSAPQYAWLNRLHIWARGYADMQKHEVRIRAYGM